ncbi:MAG: hypothetical protein HY063_04135 [Bacteroidetes bacterium]|nr:hypothetical protein [Bacteroidota bacterium]
MPSPGSRIPRDIAHFVPYMDDTDDYQQANDPNTSQPRFQNWNWSGGNSNDWHNFRTKADQLFLQYNNKKFRNSDVTEKLHKLIEKVVAYDQQEHLLDKIAATKIPPADIADFEHFHIKRGTIVADETPSRVADGMGTPTVTIKKTEHLSHTLGIANAAHKTKGKGKHIKDVQVWRALVAASAPEPDDDAYKYIGDAKRGSFKSEFEQKDVRKDAWYKARYKNTQGKFGNFSESKMESVI